MLVNLLRQGLSSFLIILAPLVALAQAHDHDDIFSLSLEQLANLSVVTASMEHESIKDTPVPVTVITEEMISHSSATHIKQLLTLFVPGFTHVEDQNEVNIAARGIFTSSQQKILFLLNGHRLNSRSYSMAAPDFTINLDKVQQIEVLRGPASSLYGNVALTAVVNIILKKGADIDGLKTRVETGNHEQQLASILWGQQRGLTDLLLWGQFYQSKGESVAIAPQQAYSDQPAHNRALISGFKDTPSIDLGIQLSHDDIEVLFNHRQSHYIEPFSAGGISGEPYDYQNYEKYRDTGPGFGYRSQHLNIKKHSIFSQHTENTTDLSHDTFEVIAPVVTTPESGGFVIPQWQEHSYSFKSVNQYNHQQHDILYGAQLDYFEVYGDALTLGDNFTTTSNVAGNEPLLSNGSETTQSLFAQYKYQLSSAILTNAGVRLDRKIRFKGDVLEVISPRLAFIFSEDDFNFKVSYSKAFVDAPYWNRFSKLASFRGANSLDPEYLSSLQINPGWQFENFIYNVNLYYSEAQDFIYLDSSAMADEANFSNSGELTYWGIEQELTTHIGGWKLQGIATYNRAHSSDQIAEDKGNIANVPTLSAALNINYDWSAKLHSALAWRYSGQQFSPINIQNNGNPATDPFPNQGVTFDDANHRVAASWRLDGNIHYQLSSLNSELIFAVENLLDRQYEQGGSVQFPYPQPGRWWRIGIKTSW